MADENNPENPDPMAAAQASIAAEATAGASGATDDAATPSGDLNSGEAEMAAAIQEAAAEEEKKVPPKERIKKIMNAIKKGDDALNRLSVQNLDFILDVPIKVTVELGRTKIMIKDLLQLGQGSVLELNKMSGEPLEILVNGRLVARGEVVVVNEKFGIRITDILGPIERIETLR